MTAYAQPAKFSHGDFPTAANLETINTALVAIAEIASDGTTPASGETLPQLNPAVYWNREKGEAFGSRVQTDSDYWILHRHRYLHYKSTGAIEDPAGTGTAVSLSNEEDFNVYDLDSVDWLAYGQMYKVTGVDFCMEDSNA